MMIWQFDLDWLWKEECMSKDHDIAPKAYDDDDDDILFTQLSFHHIIIITVFRKL